MLYSQAEDPGELINNLLCFCSGQCDSHQTPQVLKAISSCQRLEQSSSEKHSLLGNLLSDLSVNYVYVIDSILYQNVCMINAAWYFICIFNNISYIIYAFFPWSFHEKSSVIPCLKGRRTCKKSYFNSCLKWLIEWWDYEIFIFKMLPVASVCGSRYHSWHHKLIW